MHKLAFAIITTTALTGCVFGHDNQDLVDFMETTKKQKPRAIPPVPSFEAYEAFNYEAGALRSPFDLPVQQANADGTPKSSDVRPDENRVQEALEGFNLGDLTMVGVLEKSGTKMALVRDSNGYVHRVSVGNYMGQSHGQITHISASQILLTEIVPNGPDFWVERPQQISLNSDE